MDEGAVDERAGGLLAWQWSLYRPGHRTRANLQLHILTVPLFQLGALCLFAAPFLRCGWMAFGAVGMVAALVAQGRGHKGEPQAPVPFRGPGDFVARFFAEQ